MSSYKRRKTFIEHNYPCVMPVEYQLEQPGHTVIDYDSWYVEHIRSYELLATRTSLSIHLQSDLNDTVPLSAYKIGGSLLLTPKRFLQVKQN
ncbi:hypothetical protein F7725_027021 [Dissostichus mawsoni]|uniref:Uncharacterized protein n=1 Tax=Dissostichus mawsoni TaxID=36200 RepID=A0A7J5X8P0_DISMA|nr:hypothetical protein F7725_027021 [Dissostichus mawsoni]